MRKECLKEIFEKLSRSFPDRPLAKLNTTFLLNLPKSKPNNKKEKLDSSSPMKTSYAAEKDVSKANRKEKHSFLYKLSQESFRDP